MTDKTLISLDDYNQRRADEIIESGARYTGIACPECGAELFNVAPGQVIVTYPPQVSVYCEACPWTGYRLA